ncbi:hypothetical protein BH23PLA1_BH23PLA1_10650 [soil metagenome]
MTMPLLADFAVLLAGGLAVALPTVSAREVPPAFFRTICLVILGLLVLAVLNLAGSEAEPWGIWLAGGASGLAFLASVAWGLGLPRVALPLTVLIVLASGVLIGATAQASTTELWVLNGLGRGTSAGLMGSALTAMLLGHHYLTAPAMSIDPLRRLVRITGVALVLRTLLALLALWFWFASEGLESTRSAVGDDVPTLFLAMRWAMGLAVPALATFLTWETVRLRSTQSATGILYIGVALLLVGELTALILSHRVGIVF